MNWWGLIIACVVGIGLIALVLGFIGWLLSSPVFWIIIGCILFAVVFGGGGGPSNRSSSRGGVGKEKIDWNEVLNDSMP